MLARHFNECPQCGHAVDGEPADLGYFEHLRDWLHERISGRPYVYKCVTVVQVERFMPVRCGCQHAYHRYARN